MHKPFISNLIIFLFIYPLSINSAFSINIDHYYLTNQLEKGLNETNHDLLKDLFVEKSFEKFDRKYLDFTKKYKKTKWSIKTVKKTLNRQYLEVVIKSKQTIGGQDYNLNSKQNVEIETYKNKIQSYKVLSEDSILSTINNPLIVRVISPEKVLTGERYEINLIIEKPLDNSLIASGMIIIQDTDYIDSYPKLFRIKPTLSGGVFKYIQAPLDPGFQTISAIIAHPKGIYSITKKIKVDLINQPTLK